MGHASHPERIFVTLAEMAHELEMTVATLRRNMTRLQGEEGFPLASRHRLRPQVWRRSAFQVWMESQNQTEADRARAEHIAALHGQDNGNVHVLQLAQMVAR